MCECAIICPRCGQGEVLNFIVKQNKVSLWLCDECDATWFSKDNITTGPFEDFSTVMKGYGIESIWDNLERKS